MIGVTSPFHSSSRRKAKGKRTLVEWPGCISHLLTAVPWRRILAHSGYASPSTSQRDPGNQSASKGCHAMPLALISSTTADHISTFTLLAIRARRKWCPCALAILLALVAVPPSAQGQTLTTLYSFTSGADGKDPYAGVVRD